MLERAGTHWSLAVAIAVLVVANHSVRERVLRWRSPWTVLAEEEQVKAWIAGLDVTEAYASALELRRDDTWREIANTELSAREPLRARLLWLTREINRARGRRCCGTTHRCVDRRRVRGMEHCIHNPLAKECM